jgi:hypothetical protein
MVHRKEYFPSSSNTPFHWRVYLLQWKKVSTAQIASFLESTKSYFADIYQSTLIGVKGWGRIGIGRTLHSIRKRKKKKMHLTFQIFYIPFFSGLSPSTAVPFFFMPQPFSPPYVPFFTTSGTGQISPDLPMLNPPMGTLSVLSWSA